MRKIKSENELNDIINSTDVVVCKWGAPWCFPCRVIEGNIDEIEKTNGDLAEFVEVDVDEVEEDFTEKNKITNIPVLQYYKDGALIDRTVGLITEADLLDKIKELKSN